MCATSKSSSSPKSSNDTYEGISFQGNTGSLLLTTEKLVFRQKSETTCSQRTWLWSSIKKNNLVAAQDGKEDATPETRVIKISNHNHKAVSFQVPAGVAEKLQNDMTNHMVAAQELKKKADEELQEEEVEEQQQQQPQPQRPVKTRKKVPRCYTSDEKLTRAMQLAKQAKDANQAQVKASYSHTTESMMDVDAAKKIPKPSKTMRRAKSVDDTPMDNNSNSKRSSLGGSLRSSVPLSGSIHSSSVRSRNGGAFRRSCPQPKTGRPGSPTNACIKGKNGKQQGTLLQHTGMIAQDLFLKPSQQMAHDFVVRPANNLIVKGTKRNIIDPAQEKIIKPTQEKIIKPTQEKIIKPAQEKTKEKIIKPAQDNILKPAQEKIIKPAQEKIVKPTQQVASNILNPPKVIAQDMGLLSTRSRHGEDTAANGSPTTKKKAFLHFLKTPPRRTHSDDGMLDGSASGVEDPPARKSTGKFLSLRKGNLRRSKSQDPSTTATLNAMTVASSA